MAKHKKARQPRRDFDHIPDNGNGKGVDDAVVERYSTRDKQERLRIQIESQDLPVRNRLQELVDGLIESARERKGIVLLQGETGSGKSVYSPVAMREALDQLGLRDRTVMMQPRRDAASGIARASGAVMGEDIGKGVGFSTSEAKAVSGRSALTVVTPGIFLRYLMSGQLTKEQVGAVIVDELHEGSVDYHLALGLIKMMHERGTAPLTLLTSATLDKERIQNFFGINDEDYLRIEGRAHPVDKHYLEASEVQTDRRGKINYIEKTVEKVKEACASGDGDILVFMPGGREIRDTIRRIGSIEGVEVLPLYGGLGPEDRDNALSGNKRPGIQRRVIVATNIAETSITVPGIKVVVDSCRQRSVRYNPETGITEMGTELISKDQAEQRAGRAGRITAGECYRIVTEMEHQGMIDHPESEIRRTNLSNLVIRLIRLGIDPENFPFIEPPKAGAITHGIAELKELGALTEESELTSVGREMGDLPFEPRIARMVVEAKRRGCVEAGLILAAFEREPNVLLGPTRRDIEQAPGYGEGEKRKNARIAVQRKQDVFDRGNSDLLKALNIFTQAIENGVFEASRRDRSPEGRAATRQFQRWCREHYLKDRALTHIAYKLRDYARYARTRIDYSTLGEQLVSASDADLGAVILAGHTDRLIYDTGNRRGLPEYRKLGDYSVTVNLSPGSEGFDRRPQLCVTSHISQGRGTNRGREITRNYASGIHPIGLEQLREVMPHLITEQISTPQYDPETDQVQCEATFYPKGTTSVNLGSETRTVEGEEAVQAFARALANGQVELGCVDHNREINQQLDVLYHRSRGQVQKPQDMTAWYQEHLQGATCRSDATYLDDRLRLNIEQYCPVDLLQELDTYYPEVVQINGQEYTVEYYFSPAQTGWNEREERFTAKITIEPGDVMRVGQDNIPVLGDSDNQLIIAIRTQAGYTNIEGTDIEELKDKVDASRIQDEWHRWEGKPEAQEVEVQVLAPLPAIEAEPVQYALDRNGESVMAYPALTTRQEYDYNQSKYVYKYFVEYYADQEKAQSAQQQAEQRKTQDDHEEQKRLDREKILQPARDRLEAIREQAQGLYQLYSPGGQISYERYQELNQKFSQAERLLSGSDADPRQALEELQAVEDFFADRERVRAERPELLPEAEELRDAIQVSADEVLSYSRYKQYGLTPERYDELSKAWQEARGLIDNEYGDLNRAMELLRQVQAALDTDEVRRWASPEAVAYKEVRDSRGRGIYARITVRNGQVLDSQGNPIEAFTIGGSGREMIWRRGRDRKVRVQGMYSSGNPLTGVITLEDGSYAISRDADHIFSVDLEEDEVVAVHGEVDTYGSVDEPDLGYSSQPEQDSGSGFGGAFAALGNLRATPKRATTEPARAPVEPAQPTGPSLSREELEQSLGSALGRKPEPKAESTEPELPKEPSEPVQPQETDHILTEEDRAQLGSDLQYIQALIARAREIAKIVPKPKKESSGGKKKKKKVKVQETPKQKAAREITEAISGKKAGSQGLSGTLRNLEGRLSQENTMVNAMRSEIGQVRSQVERLFKRQGYQITGENASWTDSFRQIWEQVPAAVAKNEDAQDFIDEDLAEAADITREVYTELQSRIEQIQNGEDVDMDEVIEKALERI